VKSQKNPVAVIQIRYWTGSAELAVLLLMGYHHSKYRTNSAVLRLELEHSKDHSNFSPPKEEQERMDCTQTRVGFRHMGSRWKVLGHTDSVARGHALMQRMADSHRKDS
jgi:hypothetical protein